MKKITKKVKQAVAAYRAAYKWYETEDRHIDKCEIYVVKIIRGEQAVKHHFDYDNSCIGGMDKTRA